MAGYAQDDAALIAHAAQYVDDSTGNRLRVKRRDNVYHVTETAQEMMRLFASNVRWNEKDIENAERLWTAFHFLPGNFFLNKEGVIECLIPSAA